MSSLLNEFLTVVSTLLKIEKLLTPQSMLNVIFMLKNSRVGCKRENSHPFFPNIDPV